MDMTMHMTTLHAMDIRTSMYVQTLNSIIVIMLCDLQSAK